MFVLRELATIASEPLLLAATLAVVAFLSRLFLKCLGCTVILMIAGAVMYLGSTPVVGDFLLGSLERQYPPLTEASQGQPFNYIVVLGSGYHPGHGWSITGELDEDGLSRIVEGVRLQRLLNVPTMVLTGGSCTGAGAPARGYEIMARSLGVDAVAIKTLDQATNTAEEARAVANAIGPAPFLLVTSAYHMPRAVRLMREHGAKPIPAPTGRRFAMAPGWSFDRFLPSSQALRNTERALHEYLGILALNAGLQ